VYNGNLIFLFTHFFFILLKICFFLYEKHCFLRKKTYDDHERKFQLKKIMNQLFLSIYIKKNMRTINFKKIYVKNLQ